MACGVCPQKKAALLLEVLIGLSLTAIILTSLFSFFVESVRLEMKLEKAREEMVARGNLQTRLETVFIGSSRLYTDKSTQKKDKKLLLEFDNQIDPDPAFSGMIHGALYVDGGKNLVLHTSPLDESSKEWRAEILLKDVERFQFDFLKAKWSTEREKTEMGLPQVVRLTVWRPDPLQFAFHLPNADPFVTYAGGP
jgi:hypothetical protein